MRDDDTQGKLIFVHKIDGRDEANGPEVTTIEIHDEVQGGGDPASQSHTYDTSEPTEVRYRVGRIRPGFNSGRLFDVETFNSAEAAEQYAHELVEISREQYRLEEIQRRETRAWALRDLVATWHRDDPAREVLEAVAKAIGQGIEREVIEALASHDPCADGMRLNGKARLGKALKATVPPEGLCA